MIVCVSCPVYIVVRLMLFHYVYSLLSLLCIFWICWELLVTVGCW